MIATIIHLLGNMLIGICFSTVSLFFVSLAITLRLLPRLLSFLWMCLRGFLILSYRLYNMVLTPFANKLEQTFNIDILSNLSRVMFSLILSVTIYILLVHFTNLRVPDWMIAFPILHGLVVGLMWDGLSKPGGLQLGVEIQ